MFILYYPCLFCTIHVYILLSMFILYYPCLFCTIHVYFLLSMFILYFHVYIVLSMFILYYVHFVLSTFILYYPCLFFTIYMFILYYPCLFCTIHVYFHFSKQSKCPSLYTQSYFLFSAICSHTLDAVFLAVPTVLLAVPTILFPVPTVLLAVPTDCRQLALRFTHLQVFFVILLCYQRYFSDSRLERSRYHRICPPSLE